MVVTGRNDYYRVLGSNCAIASFILRGHRRKCAAFGAPLKKSTQVNAGGSVRKKVNNAYFSLDFPDSNDMDSAMFFPNSTHFLGFSVVRCCYRGSVAYHLLGCCFPHAGPLLPRLGSIASLQQRRLVSLSSSLQMLVSFCFLVLTLALQPLSCSVATEPR